MYPKQEHRYRMIQGDKSGSLLVAFSPERRAYHIAQADSKGKLRKATPPRHTQTGWLVVGGHARTSQEEERERGKEAGS